MFEGNSNLCCHFYFNCVCRPITASVRNESGRLVLSGNKPNDLIITMFEALSELHAGSSSDTTQPPNLSLPRGLPRK